MATSLGWFDLDFWWELAALVTIMLLGHWQEMKAIGQARGALAALAELIPDDAERVAADGSVDRVPITALAVGDVVLVRSGGRIPADGEVVDGDAEVDESMITGESRPVTAGRRRPGRRRHRVHRLVAAGPVTAVGDDTALAGIQRMVADAQASSSRAQVLADRFAALLFYVATGAAVATFVVVDGAGRRGRGRHQHRHRAGHRLPPRTRAGDPAGDRHLHRGVGPGRHPGQGPPGPRTHAHHRRRAVRQDRHADQGRPRRHRRRRCGRDRPTPTVLRIAGAVERDSEHPLARAITAGPRTGRTAP